MADCAIERRRVADERLDHQGGERQRQRIGKGHDGGAKQRRRRGCAHLSRWGARRRGAPRARRAAAVDRPLDRDQPARLSPARSVAGGLGAAARQRRARRPRASRRRALRRPGRIGRRRTGIAGAPAPSGAARAPRTRRRARSDLRRLRRRLRGHGPGRRRAGLARRARLSAVAIVANPNNPDGRVVGRARSSTCTRRS